MPTRPKLNVTVLLGGDTGEREVSVHSGLAVARALVRLGHHVHLLDPATGAWREVTSGDSDRPPSEIEADILSRQPAFARILPSLAGLEAGKTDLVANLLHGGAGEDGRVNAVLELLGIPYFGSAPGPSALARDKVVAKRIFRTENIPVARERLWNWGGDSGEVAPARSPVPDPAGTATGRTGPACPPILSPAELSDLGGYPVIAKPIAGGSTIGVTIIRNEAEWADAWRAAGGEIDRERGLLVEEFIPGRELTVAILGDEALPVIEIVPRTGFYDYRRKYTRGETEYHCPADLPAAVAGKVRSWGLAAFRSLGCRDFARADFRLAPDGRVAILEVNTIPGMTDTSLVPKAAAAAGVAFDPLVGRLCRMAMERAGRQLC